MSLRRDRTLLGDKLRCNSNLKWGEDWRVVACHDVSGASCKWECVNVRSVQSRINFQCQDIDRFILRKIPAVNTDNIASGKIFILFLLRDPHWAKFGSEWDDFQIAKLNLQHTLASKLSTYRQVNMPARALGITRSTFATSRQYRVNFGVQTQQFPFRSINVNVCRGNASPLGITHRTLGRQHEPEGTTCAGCDHTRRADCTLSAGGQSHLRRVITA